MKLNSVNLLIILTGIVSGILGPDCIGQSKKGHSVAIKEQSAIYETPPVYELMNIAFALTDTSIYSGNLNIYFNVIDTSKAYYREVLEYFLPYKDHELIKALNKHLSKSLMRYLYNLQKGYNSSSDNNNIKRDIHFPFFQRMLYGFNSVNRKLIEDFAKTSDFQAFYDIHRPLYQQTLADAKSKLNVKNIQQWLENEFPSRYNQFNIVISPLMNATNFTKNFSFKGNKISLMWVADASGYDTNEYTPNQIAGIYTGVVFTEIDHNYIGPVSDHYKRDINQVMGDDNRAKWIKADGDGKFYSNGCKIFNEYMTHAVYLVYTNAIYSKEDQAVIENKRINLMEQRRKYFRFGDFYLYLKSLYASKKEGETIPNLYPKMIAWCKQQNGEG